MSRFIALAAGGTGGHMFPAQALAEEMRRRGWRVLLLTDARGLRYAESFPADDIVELTAANPNVPGLASKVAMLRTMATGFRQARRALSKHKPAFAVGFGGYPSAPGLFAARSLGIPYGVHEQNAVLGRVNRRAASGAKFVAHTFERLDKLPPVKGEVFQTGNPVRDAVIAARSAFHAPEGKDPIRVLIFGGSQGAALFAKIFPTALASLPPELRERLLIVHQVPEDYHAAVAEIYGQARITAELAPFFTDLPARLANAHYVVARAGASSVAELSIIGRPALLVPLGIAMDDHQRINAEVLANAGAADILLEADASPEAAAALLLPRLSDAEGLKTAATAALGRVPENAAARLADHIEGLLNG